MASRTAEERCFIPQGRGNVIWCKGLIGRQPCIISMIRRGFIVIASTFFLLTATLASGATVFSCPDEGTHAPLNCPLGGVAQAGTTSQVDYSWNSEDIYNPIPPVLAGASWVSSGYGSSFVFGGCTSEPPCVPTGQAWSVGEFNASWVNLATGPSARSDAAVATFPNSTGVLLFGGLGRNDVPLNDTWIFQNKAWTNLTPTLSTSPPARGGATMISDGSVDLLFGGLGRGSSALGDTWIFDGHSWKQLTVAPSPSPRFDAMLGWDIGAGGGIFLFGGCGKACPMNDTWEFEGGKWLNVSTTHSPSGRLSGALIQGGTLGEGCPASTSSGPKERMGSTSWPTQYLVLFGGNGSAGPLNDTWLFDGSNWMRVNPTSSPSPRSQVAGLQGSLFSSLDGAILGGYDGKALGGIYSWQAIAPSNCGPLPISNGPSIFFWILIASLALVLWVVVLVVMRVRRKSSRT